MRRPDALAGDRRGVSTAIGYVLTLSVTTLLVGGLLIGIGTFVDDQRTGTARDELRVIGQQVASDVSAADRLVRAGRTSEVRITRQLPETVTGSAYTIEIQGGDPIRIELRTRTPEVTVDLTIHVGTPVSDTTVDGGAITVRLTASDELEVTGA